MQREAARRIEASLDHMLRHFNEPLRIGALSLLAGISDSHFFSLFRCATGYSPRHFLVRVRMERARELLEDTTRSLKEVAAILRYAAPFYFSRVFKPVNGIAPGEYWTLAPEFKAAVRKTAWPWNSSDGLGVEMLVMAHRRRSQYAPRTRRMSPPVGGSWRKVRRRREPASKNVGSSIPYTNGL